MPDTLPAPKRAVVLDICGTLAPEDSWLALTRDMGASVDRHLEIYHAYREGRITYEESKIQLVGLWHTTGHANRQAMQDIFESWPLDPAAKPLVDFLHAHNYHPLIITGSVDLYAQAVAQRLGITDWYANTPLIVDDTGKLVTYHYDLDQSGKKVRQLEAFCTQYGLDPAQAIAIGDGPNDLGLFRATGRGILLDTPRATDELKTAAWRTIERLAAAAPLLREVDSL